MQGEMVNGKPDYTGCEWDDCNEERCWGDDPEEFDYDRAELTDQAQEEGEPIRFRLELWVEGELGESCDTPCQYLYVGHDEDGGGTFDSAEDLLRYLSKHRLPISITSLSKYCLLHLFSEEEILPPSKSRTSSKKGTTA
jgi:hypothetical protein